MSDDDHSADPTGGLGDPVREMLLGLAGQIDQLAGLLGGGSTDSGESVAGLVDHDFSALLTGFLGEADHLITEIGDLIARMLAALITVLEAIAEMLRSAPADGGPAPTPFQRIPVRITAAGTHP